MQTCYNCGKEVDDTVLICPDCGALVKRYGRPEPVQPEAAPSVPFDSADAPIYGAVLRDENGRLRFRGSVKFWLILSIIAALYSALSLGSSLMIYRNQDYFMAAMQEYAELAPMEEMMQLLMDSMEAFAPYYAGMAIGLVIKGLCGIAFLSSKRRTFFWIMAGVSGVLVLAELIFGTFLSALLFALDVVIVYLLLRRDWKTLPQ